MIQMYTTPTCGHCSRLKSQLDRVGIDYEEINVEDNPIAAQYVMRLNGGVALVPTVVLPNGSALTNPTVVQIRQRLAALA